MDLNEPDPHTGYPMGSYRQDPTGRYQPTQVDDGPIGDEMFLILGQGILAGMVGTVVFVVVILWIFW